eukprot:983262-Prorocentrum_minimum.AAC.1
MKRQSFTIPSPKRKLVCDKLSNNDDNLGIPTSVYFRGRKVVHEHTQKGNIVDVKGNIVDVEGTRVDVKGNIVDGVVCAQNTWCYKLTISE